MYPPGSGKGVDFGSRPYKIVRMPTRVRSHAKINLGLGIGAPRPDGFHGLATVYQTLEMHDILTVSARLAPTTALRLTSNDSRVPCDERNTAWKMVALALDALGITADVEIHIEKQLPVQGGLGAGSANAVAALVALEYELGIAVPPTNMGNISLPSTKAGAPGASPLGTWESKNLNQPGAPGPSPLGTGEATPSTIKSRPPTNLGAPGLDSETWESNNPNPSSYPARRFEIATKVGSDVPLFLIGGTVLGTDRGQIVHPLPDLEPVWCVVVAPELGVSTPKAFRDWDLICLREGLTQEASACKLNKLSCAYQSAFGVSIPEVGPGSSGVFAPENDLKDEDRAGPHGSELVRTGITSWIENDFERVVFPQHPSLAEIKLLLAAPDTKPEAARQTSCLMASLSGSGSALFGLYGSRGDAEAAMNRVNGQVQSVKVRSTLTRTQPRADYWRQMIL